jgi:hypothetical protein
MGAGGGGGKNDERVSVSGFWSCLGVGVLYVKTVALEISYLDLHRQ